MMKLFIKLKLKNNNKKNKAKNLMKKHKKNKMKKSQTKKNQPKKSQLKIKSKLMLQLMYNSTWMTLKNWSKEMSHSMQNFCKRIMMKS